MNKKILIVLFGIMFVMATAGPSEDEAKTTIDQAADVLRELLSDAQQNLADLNAAWEAKKPILETQVSNLEQSLKEKLEECAAFDVVKADRERQLADAQDYVAWLHNRIQENENYVKNLLEQRCQQNGNYIEGLKNDKISVKLLQFLRQQIQAKESFSFAQRKSFNAKLKSFLSIYKTGNYDELVQLQQDFDLSNQYSVENNQDISGRSSDQIGAGHVDNNQGELEVENFQNGERKGWLQVKQELLDLLNNLETVVQNKMQKAQEDEVRSSVAAADYKLKLEHENEVYESDLLKWNQIVSDLVLAVAFDQQNCNQCRSEELQINGQLADAKNELAQQTAEYVHKNSNFEEEVAIFNEVIQQYIPAAESQGAEFKERADDYIDNGNFDNGSYNQREVPQIDLLQ